MSGYGLFITAPDSNDTKFLNSLLIKLHDFEFNEEELDSYTLISTHTIPRKEEDDPKNCPSIAPPVPADALARNEWVGASIAEIHAWMRTHYTALHDAGIDQGSFVIVDWKGKDEGSALVCERIFVYGEEERAEVEADGGRVEFEDGRDSGYRTDKCRAMRVPLWAVWSIMANLTISNMDFDAWADEDNVLEGEDNVLGVEGVYGMLDYWREEEESESAQKYRETKEACLRAAEKGNEALRKWLDGEREEDGNDAEGGDTDE